MNWLNYCQQINLLLTCSILYGEVRNLNYDTQPFPHNFPPLLFRSRLFLAKSLMYHIFSFLSLLLMQESSGSYIILLRIRLCIRRVSYIFSIHMKVLCYNRENCINGLSLAKLWTRSQFLLSWRTLCASHLSRQSSHSTGVPTGFGTCSLRVWRFCPSRYWYGRWKVGLWKHSLSISWSKSHGW